MNKFLKIVSAVIVCAVMAGVASAATKTNTVGGTTFGAAQAPGSYKMVGLAEFDKQSLAAGETVAVIAVPAKSYVAAVAYEVTVALTNDVQFDVGDASSTNYYCNLSAVASTSGVSGVSAYTAAKGYMSAGQINVHMRGASGDTGKVKVTATVFDLK